MSELDPNLSFQTSIYHPLLVWKQWLCYNYPLCHPWLPSTTKRRFPTPSVLWVGVQNVLMCLAPSRELSSATHEWLSFTSTAWKLTGFFPKLCWCVNGVPAVNPTKDAPEQVYVGHTDVQMCKTHPGEITVTWSQQKKKKNSWESVHSIKGLIEEHKWTCWTSVEGFIN